VAAISLFGSAGLEFFVKTVKILKQAGEHTTCIGSALANLREKALN